MTTVMNEPELGDIAPEQAWAKSTPRMAKTIPYYILAGALLVSAIYQLFQENFSVAGLMTIGALLYAVVLVVTSLVIEGGRWAKDRLATVLVTAAFLMAMIPLISLIWTVLSRGLRLFSLQFLTSDMNGVYGEMTTGGVKHAIIGTMMITLGASAIAVPIGILTAVYLVEYGKGKLAKAITTMVDIMTGIPSIVAGLFAFALFTLIFGPAYRSGLMGSVALAVLMTPVVVRSVEEMLRLVPNELREASYALGVPKWLTIVKVVLRTAAAGIVTGVMLAVARVIGETAPLLITVGIIPQVNWDLFDGRMTTLPVLAYTQYSSGGMGVDRAWAAALTLILIVMLLNLVARLINRYFAPKGGH